MAFLPGTRQWRDALEIRVLRIGARRQEHAGRIERSVFRRVMERREAGEVRRFDRGAVCREEPDRVDPIVDCRPLAMQVIC